MDEEKNFFQAIIDGKTKELELLISTNPCLLEARTENGISCLMLAAYARQKEVMEIIVKNISHMDIFEAAALGDKREIARNLQRSDSVVNGISPDGFSPLGLASFFGHEGAVDLLLEHGADVNQISKNKLTVAPLHSAAAAGHENISRLLLEKGADINTRQQMGITPLHSAAHNGNIDMVKLFVGYGADISAADSNGKTASDHADEQGHHEVAEWIRTNMKT